MTSVANSHLHAYVSQVTGLVAHPGRITSLALSCDGKYLFSGGGSDLTTNMWTVDVQALYAVPDNVSSAVATEEPLAPYLELLEGGPGGQLHNDIVDYFYYVQIRSHGEGNLEERQVTGRVQLEDLPSLMRAVGSYPTEEECTNLINEVRCE